MPVPVRYSHKCTVPVRYIHKCTVPVRYSHKCTAPVRYSHTCTAPVRYSHICLCQLWSVLLWYVSGTRYPQVNKKIERFINKKKVFPDYHDIRNVIRFVNKDKRLHLRYDNKCLYIYRILHELSLHIIFYQTSLRKSLNAY